MHRHIPYIGAGRETAVPSVTRRIVCSFLGVLLFNVGLGLNRYFGSDWLLIIGALLVPVGAFLAFTIKNGCPWQRRLALASFVINATIVLFVIWLICTAKLNRAT
jgi:hypothetical protein